MRISVILLPVSAALFAGCVTVAPSPSNPVADPSDPSAPEASARHFHPNLVATTQVYLDPSVGKGAQKMDHSKMQGMDNMSGMNHSQMPGMEPKQAPATSPAPSQPMQQMDHSKMPGMEKKQPPGSPLSKEALEVEMKKTSDEMKKLSDELKKKADEKSTRPSPSPK